MRTVPLKPIRSAAEIANVWLQIIAIVAIAGRYLPWWLLPFAGVIIAARQYALGVLLHEAQHSLLHPRRQINDWIGRWLLAAPLWSDFAESRAHHLAHHTYLGDPFRDPDYPLYAGSWLDHRAAARSDPDAILVAQFLIATTCAFITWVWWGAALWLVPLLLAGIFDRLRILCEHSSPTGRIWMHRSNVIERFFFAPFHMNHHAEHHIWPYLPHYQLTNTTETLAALMPPAEWARGTYIAHLRELLR